MDTNDMTHEPTRGATPRLRFPEFRDAGEWEEKSLGSIASFYKGKGISKADIAPKGETLCIRYGELYTIYDEVVDRVVSKTNLSVSELFLSQKNDILIPSSGETKLDIAKASCVLLDDVALGGDLNILRTNENGIFLSYSLNGPYKREIAKKAQGDTVVHLYANQLKLLKVLIPKPPEQRRIADCLASLDDLIAAQGQKLAALKAHKKGLMQQLFPAEGETVPRLRFPEFRDAGEWEGKLLGSIASFYKGKGISKADIAPKGETLCIRYGELYTIYDEVIDRVVSKTSLSVSELFLSQRNDILIPSSGETKLDIAKASCVLLDDVALGSDLNILRTNENGIFLSYLLNGPYKREIAKKAQGDTVVHLYANQLKLLKVLIPKPPEQQRIADFLSSIDDLIAAQAQKLDALKAHKKGLMQQLFPVVEP